MNNQPIQPNTVPPYVPPKKLAPDPFPCGAKELVFALIALAAGLILANFTLFGGFRLGFAIAIDLCILISAGYLLAWGHRPTPYSAALLILSLVIGAGFARSDDGFVKFVMVLFLFFSTTLGLVLLSGKQRYRPGGFLTVCDCFHTGTVRSLEDMGPAFSGLKNAVPKNRAGFRKFSAVFIGLLISLPVVAILIVLLMRADAAFQGLIDLLPSFSLWEAPGTVSFGVAAFCLLFCQAVSLQHRRPAGEAKAGSFKGVNSLTVNTVLIAAGVVYAVYLLSQLAYFVGGFAGILPEGYTAAEYARRGFFEMAGLCAVNLALIGLCVGLVVKKPAAPLLTRLLCLFISLITVFFVATASGKMFLYMDSFGLTRLRVLTQVIMLWIGLSTVLVAVWLLAPRLPYMKAIVLAGLLIGAAVLWADVDHVVAGYNVDRYLSGRMETVDVEYLGTLNRSAVPHVARLAEKAPDDAIRARAKVMLQVYESRPWQWEPDGEADFRDWTWAEAAAAPYLPEVLPLPDDSP